MPWRELDRACPAGSSTRDEQAPPNRTKGFQSAGRVQSRRTQTRKRPLRVFIIGTDDHLVNAGDVSQHWRGGDLPTGYGRTATSGTQQKRCIHFVGVPRPTATEKRHGVLLLLGVLEAHGNNQKGFRLPKATAAKMMGVTRRTVQRWAKELHPLGLIDDAPDGIKIGTNYAAWCRGESTKAKANGTHWQRDALPSRILHANAKAQPQTTPCVLVAAAGIWQEADDAREFVRGSRERAETAATSRRTVTAAIKLLVGHKAITLQAITRTIKKRLCRLLKVETTEKMAKVCSLAVGFARLAAWEQHAKHGAGGATGGNHGGATGEHHPHLSFRERSSSLRTNREENRILKNAEMIAQPRERQTLGQLASKIQQEQGALTSKNQQAKRKAMVRLEVRALAADEPKLEGLLMHPNQCQSVNKLLLLAGVYELGITGKRRAKLNRKRDQLAQSLVAVHKHEAASFIWHILSRTCKTERVKNIGAFLAVSSVRSLQIQRQTKPKGFAPQTSLAMLAAVESKLADYRFSWDHKAITKNNELVMQRNNITHEVIAIYLNMPLEEFEAELTKRIKRTA